MEELKNMKVGDLINLLVNVINNNQVEKTEKIILSKQEVLEQFPIFTENTLRKAIKFQGLEYIKSGRNKYFDKDNIESWLDSQKQKEVYDRFDGIKF